MPKKTKTVDLAEELQDRFDRWDNIYENGCGDPTWSDGVNLNLVRNHILGCKRRIEESHGGLESAENSQISIFSDEIGNPLNPNYPEIYYREAPPEVDRDYMARSDEIRDNAKKSLQLYKADENYLFLLDKVDSLSPKEQKSTCINAVIGYVRGLENAIESDELVAMRRHENPDGYLESFRDCVDRVNKLENVETEQFEELDEPDDDMNMDETEEIALSM